MRGQLAKPTEAIKDLLSRSGRTPGAAMAIDRLSRSDSFVAPRPVACWLRKS